jgi:hypothetical protein
VGGRLKERNCAKLWTQTTRTCSTYEQVILIVSPFGAYAMNTVFVTHVAERETEEKENQAGHRGLITPDNDITYR